MAYIDSPTEDVPAPASQPPAGLYLQLAQYLELLLKWNAKTNLTAIRDPEEIVRRHFGESLYAARHLEVEADGAEAFAPRTLLDFGSGAGFPGLPIQLLWPDLQVTLAESQNKKAAFLREAVRTLGLKTEVWPNRVEAMPPERRFDVVALRAVDNMAAAIEAALPRALGSLLLLTTVRHRPASLPGFVLGADIPIPGTQEQVLVFARRMEPVD
jgi:16S rRNA (guanine527-N7)-methyltransferase